MTRLFLTLFMALSIPIGAFAGTYSGVLDTGETVKPGGARTSLELFTAFNAGGQINPLFHFDYGLLHDLEIGAFLGTGSVEFQAGGQGQYMILPDVNGQVGLSATSNMRYRLAGQSGFLWEVYPTVSKKFRYKKVQFTPYGSFQLGLEASAVRDTVRLNLVTGTEVKPIEFKTLTFFGEFGFNIYRSAWSLSLQASLDFDDLLKWNKAEYP